MQYASLIPENALVIALNEQDLIQSETEIKKAITVREINPKKTSTEHKLEDLQAREDVLRSRRKKGRIYSPKFLKLSKFRKR
jgi:hypothetical protein